MKWTLILVLATAAFAADGPSLFYSKNFPESKPPYVEINLARNGAIEYREAPGEDNPVKLQLKQAEADEIFGLVQKAGSFKRPLESPAKVAFMGTKTFRYENGAEKDEIKFNYTQDAAAQALTDWFERVGESAQRLTDLERTAKYDKLGVVDALIQVEISLDHKRLVAGEQFLPLLDRIANNQSYMHTAQVRAAEIAAAIRNPKP